MLASSIDNYFLNRIADAFRNARRLYVTATDLTNSKTIIEDMSAIAASAKQNRKYCSINILLASIAVPGLIDLVIISI